MKPPRWSSILLLTAICCSQPARCNAQGAASKGDSPSQATGQSADRQRLLYESWIRNYRTGPLRGALGIQQREIKLVITVVEGDDLETDPKTVAMLGPSYRTTFYGCAVSIDGTVSYSQRSTGGVKGSGLATLTKDELDRLIQLVEQLPEDNSILPPVGRRIILQVTNGSEVVARVYDRANAPDEILEILRLTQSGIKSWAPRFEPLSKWTAGDFSSHGGFSLSADGRQIVTSGANGPFRIWDAESFALLKELPLSFIPLPDGNLKSPTSVFGLDFSPDGSLVIVDGTGQVDVRNARSWEGIRQLAEPFVARQWLGLTCPIFTPDGRFLLLQSDEPALRIFDTTTWNKVDSIPGIAPGAVAYFPAQNGDRAIYASKNGSIGLWDPHAHREVAELDTNGRILRVSFSPDESLVAVLTLHQNSTTNTSNNYRLRIWRASNGELAHELRPFEQQLAFETVGILWWPNSKYLLAATRSDFFFTTRSVGIWNVESGRFRGEFSGCVTSVYGFALLPDGKRLVEGCGDGTVFVWDAASAIAKINQFENSLPQD